MLNPLDKNPLEPLNKTKIEIEKINSVENFNKYIKNKEGVDSLLALAYRAEIHYTRCRWSLWRKFLKAIPDGTEAEVRKAVKTGRDFYKEKLASYIHVRAKKAEMDDPLSRGANNPWNSFYEDGDLKNSIKIDVDRT